VRSWSRRCTSTSIGSPGRPRDEAALPRLHPLDQLGTPGRRLEGLRPLGGFLGDAPVAQLEDEHGVVCRAVLVKLGLRHAPELGHQQKHDGPVLPPGLGQAQRSASAIFIRRAPLFVARSASTTMRGSPVRV
jgi:hypothetical protein